MSNRPLATPLASLALGLALTTATASARADAPTALECISANEDAITRSKQERLLEARERYLVCAAPSCPDDIRVECSRRVEEVNAALPSVVIEAKDASGVDVVLEKVEADGGALGEAANGAPITLNPGPHRFRFVAPGREPLEKTLVLRAGEKGRRERVTFAATPSPSTGAPLVSVVRKRDSTRVTLGLATAAAGLVGVAVGAIFGVRAASSWNDAKTACPSAADCPRHDQAQSSHDDAVLSATVSTVSVIAGGVLFAVGGVTFLTAPWVTSKRSGGLSVTGTF